MDNFGYITWHYQRSHNTENAYGYKINKERRYCEEDKKGKNIEDIDNL